MPSAKPLNESAICDVLSAPRSTTYITAVGGDKAHAMELYGWNARIAAAFMLPSHFAEITVRNAASEAIAATYGPRWPWSTGFERALNPPKSRAYDPQRDLIETRKRHTTTDKVIAELKFKFWQSMFTARHDHRLWNRYILTLFPNAKGMTAAQLRHRIYDDLEAIRTLRNRLAHHEPIFTRNLEDDLMRMLELVELRSTPTLDWVCAMEDVTSILAERP
ncbi:hypothetical protein [Nocardia bovistercoris]|uniref:Abi-like protein n=1 Tax=Nocardia bovistercoris TaxID=2785916 RepID=A0A931IFG0_9NOCA|nr:hypothetical protein [Nocardia bovistercoris]MBH0779102.1 hypothetical protein [Nocardia bovistercoris]